MSETMLDYEPLRAALAADGWDVVVGDALHARREDRGGVWRLAIDRGGRVRFVSMRPLRPSAVRRLVRGGRRYRLLREEDVTLTILSQIEDTDALPRLLDDLAALLQVPWEDADAT
jgi:hypothetical protein